jgi:hypothetical protein
MSQATALAVARELRMALLDHGAGKIVSPFTKRVGGVSIELMEGRGPKGDTWHCKTHVAHLNHHTAGPTITADRLTPILYICKHGRSDLQGPICNGYGGGDFIYRIITLGWANHPGLGGPATFAGKTVPKDNGRPYLFGTEWDWPGLLSTPWPSEYVEWMHRCNAGILDWLDRPADAQGEHKDPWAPDRKVDRRLITRTQSVDGTRRVWNLTTAPTEEDDVTPAEVEAAIRKVLRLPDSGLAVPYGQAHNGNLAVNLTGMGQGQTNALGAVRAAVAAVQADQAVSGEREEKALALLAEIEADLPEPAA